MFPEENDLRPKEHLSAWGILLSVRWTEGSIWLEVGQYVVLCGLPLFDCCVISCPSLPLIDS